MALLDAAHPDGPASGSELPSARLARLAPDAAAELARLPPVDGTGIDLLPPPVLSKLTRVVDASLAAASRGAYRADWDRFRSWATDTIGVVGRWVTRSSGSSRSVTRDIATSSSESTTRKRPMSAATRAGFQKLLTDLS